MLCSNVISDPAYPCEPKQALSRGYIRTDAEVDFYSENIARSLISFTYLQYIRIANRGNRDDGTTAVSVLVHGDTIFVANGNCKHAYFSTENCCHMRPLIQISK